MTHNNLRDLNWTRKPATWADVYTTVAGIDLPQDLPRYDAQDLGIRLEPLRDFRIPVEAQYFIVTVPTPAGDTFYVVNTEGHTYARYITKVM